MAEFDDKLSRILSNPDAMAQIARLAQSLDAPPNAPPPMENAPNIPPPNAPPNVPPQNAPNVPPPNAPNVPPQNAPPVPHGGTDGNTVAQFLPLLQELGGDSDARRLLHALRPYLRPHKQEKVEQALRLARLFRVGKKFLSQWEG